MMLLERPTIGVGKLSKCVSPYRLRMYIDQGLPLGDGDLGSLFQLVKEISVPRTDTVMALTFGVTR